MDRIHSITLLLLCLATVEIAVAQADRIDQLKNVIPPSPEAASLGKYAEWPVNLYTGLPSISVPLHELKGRGISVPISLSYHASGIRVTDISSSIGLGWALNASGIISRSVKGLPDNHSNGYFNFRNKFTDPNDLSSPPKAGEVKEQLIAWVVDGEQDGEQDAYTINALGKSYKLLFLANGNIITDPVSQIKVTANFTTDTWTVVLEDGTVLVFGGSDAFVERTDNPRADIPLYTSSWLLKSMTSISGEQINFTYTLSGGVGHPASTSRKDKIENTLVIGPDSKVNEGSRGFAPCACTDGMQGGGAVGNGGDVEQTVGVQMVQSIESELERAEFVLGPSRLDLAGAYPYASLKIFSKLSGTYTHEYRFNTAYSQAIAGSTFATSDNEFKQKRLKLNSIDNLVPGTSTVISKWSFEYNPQNLPSRVSSAQDHWGYFNGSVQNESFLPRLAPVGYYDGFTPNKFKGGNREPDANYMKAETLMKIVYPTGGFTNFEYEPNSFPKDEEQFENATIESTIRSSEAPFVATKTITFQLTAEQYVNLEVEALFSDAYLNDHSPTNTLAYASIIAPDGSTVGMIGFKKSGLERKYFTIKKGLDDTSFVPGSYTLKLWSKGDFVGDQDIYLNARLKYSKSLGVKAISKAIGGLRIKTITDYDRVGALPIVRSFKYDDVVVLNEFNPLEEYVTTVTEEARVRTIICPGGLCEEVCDYIKENVATCFQDYLVRTAYAKTSIPSYPVGYGKVTTLYGALGENGRSVNIYSNKTDNNITGALRFPFPSAESNEWQRGTLLQEIELNATLDTLKKVKNIYQAEQSQSQLKMLKPGRAVIYHTLYNDQYRYNGILTVYYKIITGRHKLLSTVETDYSGGKKLLTKTSYFYDNPANLLPTRIETLDSEAKLIKKQNWTALEKDKIQLMAGADLSPAASAAIDFMLGKNMITQVIAAEEYTQGIPTKKVLTNYKVNNNIALPDYVMTSKGENPLEKRIQFTAYDAQGNLLEQSKFNDVNHAYIWDYSNSYLIAEVVNANQSQIAFTGFEADGNGNWSIPSARNAGGVTGLKSYSLTNGNITKAGLPNTTDYVVSFWATSSDAQVNGQGPIAGQTRNGWTHYQITIKNASDVTVSGAALIDDLRLYPKSAQMTTYTYQPIIGLTSKTDANNQSTYYEYDAANRLQFIRDDKQNILKHFQYNYQTR